MLLLTKRVGRVKVRKVNIKPIDYPMVARPCTAIHMMYQCRVRKPENDVTESIGHCTTMQVHRLLGCEFHLTSSGESHPWPLTFS